MLNALARDWNASDSGINRRVEIWHLPGTRLDVVSSDPSTLGGYPHNGGRYSIVRDATILASLDAASPSCEPQEPAE